MEQRKKDLAVLLALTLENGDKLDQIISGGSNGGGILGQVVKDIETLLGFFKLVGV
jgi:hypothetical protein